VVPLVRRSAAGGVLVRTQESLRWGVQGRGSFPFMPSSLLWGGGEVGAALIDSSLLTRHVPISIQEEVAVTTKGEHR
jgi:hypothetical protein